MNLLPAYINVKDKTWFETIRLFSGLLNYEDRLLFITDLSRDNILLAAECLTYSLIQNSIVEDLITQKSIHNIIENSNPKTTTDSILSLIELNKINHLSSLVNFFSTKKNRGRSNSRSRVNKGLINLLCETASKDQIILFIKEISSFVNDDFLNKIVFNPNSFEFLANSELLLYIRGKKYWESIIIKLIFEPEKPFEFNCALHIRDKLLLNDKIPLLFILNTFMSEIEKISNIKNLRYLIEFLNYCSINDREYLLSKIKKAQSNLFILITEYYCNIDLYTEKYSLLLLLLKYYFRKENSYSLNDFSDLRSVVMLGKFDGRKKGKKAYFLPRLEKTGYIKMREELVYEVIKEPDMLMSNLILGINKDITKIIFQKFIIGDIILCRVFSLKKSHATIQLDEGGFRGSLYIGDIGYRFIKDISNELYVGQRIIAKIIGFNEKHGFKLSMKDVHKS